MTAMLVSITSQAERKDAVRSDLVSGMLHTVGSSCAQKGGGLTCSERMTKDKDKARLADYCGIHHLT
jgi:hypothetical protein